MQELQLPDASDAIKKSGKGAVPITDTPQARAVSILAERTALPGGYAAGILSKRDSDIYKRQEQAA